MPSEIEYRKTAKLRHHSKKQYRALQQYSLMEIKQSHTINIVYNDQTFNVG